MDNVKFELEQTISVINNAWRSGRVSEMNPYLHPDIVMKFPKFSGEMSGRDKMIEGFKEFCGSARVIEYTESDQQVEIIGDTAVVSFRFDMLYERPKYRERSTGRDVWIFHRESNRWLAVWRTMVDLTEAREQL